MYDANLRYCYRSGFFIVVVVFAAVAAATTSSFLV